MAKNGIVQELIQVSYNVTSERTRQREINALLRGAKKFNCRNLTLITFGTEQTIEKDNETINVLPATKWLLGTKKRPQWANEWIDEFNENRIENRKH